MKAATGENKPRGAAARPDAPAKSNLPIIIGACAGGGVLVIILVVVMMNSGGPEAEKKTAKPKAAEAATTPAEELEGRDLCQKGKTALDRDVIAYNNSGPLDRAELRKRVFEALGTLRQGLDYYRKAEKKTGMKYPVGDLQGLFDKTLARLEGEAKVLCDKGRGVIDAQMPNLSAAGDAKEKAMTAIEQGLRDMRDGLDAYKCAATAASKPYDVTSHQRAFDAAVERYAKDLEAEAAKDAAEGLKLLKSVEGIMNNYTEAQKPELREKLKTIKNLLKHSNELFSRINEACGKTYDTREATEAFKFVRDKLKEVGE